jgi:hypothetical protein
MRERIGTYLQDEYSIAGLTLASGSRGAELSVNLSRTQATAALFVVQPNTRYGII